MSKVPILLAVVVVTGNLAAQSISGPFERQHTIHGLAAGDFLGFAVDGVGDVNLDGFDDFIAGAVSAKPGGRNGAGSAFVFSGKDGTVVWQFDGLVAGDGLGISVRGAGDVNNDGFPDVVVGASRANPGGRSDAGSAYVYSGKDGSMIWQFDGPLSGDQLGHYVDGAGDVNRDSFDDIIVGAPFADPGGISDAGSAFVYSGKDGTLIWGFHGGATDDLLGWAVAGAGDTNDDSSDDVIVGVRFADPGGKTDAGSAVVYSGENGTKLRQFDGETDLDEFGRSVDGAGDVNNDGCADLIVGSPRAAGGGLAGAGSAFVYSGRDGSLIWRFNGPTSGADLGTAVSGAGDVNGDRRADVIVGARLASPAANTSGMAFVYSGADGTVLGQFDATGSAQRLGFAVGEAGDTNGDGCADVIVGARFADGGPGSISGAALLFAYDLETTWNGSASSDWLDSSNWSNGVPTSAMRVVIPQTVTSPVIELNEDCKSLTMEAGATLEIQSGAVLSVHGGATISGSVVGNGLVRFDSAGSAKILGTPGGDLGDVQIDGGVYTIDGLTITGNLTHTDNFPKPGDLWVGTVTVEENARFEGDRTLALGTRGDLVVKGNVRYATRSTTTSPPSFIRCRGDWFATSTFSPSAGTIFFDGNGVNKKQTAEAEEWNNVVIERQAEVTMKGSNNPKVVVRGQLDVQGKLDTDEPDLEVEGDLTIGADGEVTNTNTDQNTTTTVTLGGDLSIAGTFQSFETLRMNGPDPTSLDILDTLEVDDVLIENAERRAESSFTIDANTLHIAAGGGLSASGQTVNLDPIAVTVDGLLAAGPGGTFAADAGSSITVTTGTLRLVGSPADPARLIGFMGGGYRLEITDTGTLEAANFEVRGADKDGLQIRSGATIASPPNDLRGGQFADGDPSPQSVLLTLERSSPVELRYLAFENAGTATFNVRSSTTAPINLVNYEGAFGGPVFEDDPNNIITWTANDRTDVASFQAIGALNRVALTLTTNREVDVASFHILRSDNAGGPFEEVIAFSSQGNPSSGTTYEVFDSGVTYPTQYFYRLEEELLHGVRRSLSSDFARPLPMQVGNSYFVGSGGFADIAAAVAGAPAGANILVAAGTYAPFSTNKAVRIFADGSGPVHIDTSTAPVVIRDIAANQPDTSIYGLDIGNGSAAFGLEIRNCDNVTVLDRVVITTMGVSAVVLDDSPKVAVQSCTISGGPGLEVTNGSTVFLSKGTLNSLVANGGSSVTYVEVPPFTTTVSSATVQALAGTMPRVEFPSVWPTGKELDIAVSGNPGDRWGLFFTPKKGFTNASAVLPGDMVILLDPPLAAVLLFAGSFPAGGQVEFTVPADLLFEWGINLGVQLATLSPALLRFRLGNVRDVVIFP